jgi:Mn-dependent DtxR family transcriptional regulator
MIGRSSEEVRTGAIAAELRYRPQTVRERLLRFKTEDIGRRGDRAGPATSHA